ncbi:MAG: hypothetical protein QW578_05705 [Thermoplasmatales archaeon]
MAVKDYDLIPQILSVTTTASPLLYAPSTYSGGTPIPVVTPDDYVQKIYKMTITNTGTSTEIVTLIAQLYPYNETNISYTVATYSIPAGDTISISENDLDIILSPGYNLAAVTNTGTANIQLLSYFSPA